MNYYIAEYLKVERILSKAKSLNEYDQKQYEINKIKASVEIIMILLNVQTLFFVLFLLTVSFFNGTGIHETLFNSGILSFILLTFFLVVVFFSFIFIGLKIKLINRNKQIKKNDYYKEENLKKLRKLKLKYYDLIMNNCSIEEIKKHLKENKELSIFRKEFLIKENSIKTQMLTS